MLDLNPEIQELIEIATKGFDIFESARMRVLIRQRIEGAALCGVILRSQVHAIILEVLHLGLAQVRQEQKLLDDWENVKCNS